MNGRLCYQQKREAMYVQLALHNHLIPRDVRFFTYRGNLKGVTIATAPTTTNVTNIAAPKSSPIARPAVFARMAEKVENKSGAPFPGTM